MLPDFGEIIFSVVVTYMGAIELFYVMKHLYHLAFQHEARGRLLHDDSLKELQKKIQDSIDDAAKNEIYGLKAMKDGVMYKDGFRVDPNDIDFSTIDRQVIGSSRNSLENITENYEPPTEPVLEKKEYDYDEKNLVEVCEEPCVKKVIAPLTPPVPKNIEPKQSTPLNTFTDTKTDEGSDEYNNTTTTNGLNHTQTNRTVKTQLTQQYRDEVEEPIIVKKSVDPLRSKTPTTFAEPVVSDSSVGASAGILENQSENVTSVQNQSIVSKEAEAQRPITPVKQIGQNENLQQVVPSEQIVSESNVPVQIKEEEAYQRPRTPVKHIEEQQQNLRQSEELQQFEKATTPIEESQQFKKASTPIEELQQFKQASTPIEELQFQKASTTIEELQQFQKATTPNEEESYHRPTTPIKQTEELQQYQKATPPIEEEFHHRPTTPIKQAEESQQPTQHHEKHEQQSIVPPQIEEPAQTFTTNERFEDSSSNEPLSSKQSSISNQKSSSLETSMSIPEIEMSFQEYEREAPEGQDMPELPQYSEEYLRSLDGLKYRPLVRDDGTKRRRAFKKRRSSNESTSSRESRASREEELKMFTSLEEEEFAAIKRGESDVVPIKYSSEPNLKIGKHHRRHKKSPMKDTKKIETEESRSSLEMLNEEDTNPWGEVKPEHYKNAEFWQREKTISIEEESDDSPKTLKEHDGEEPQQAGELTVPSTPSKHMPHMSSFEEATESQHQCVVPQLQRRGSRDTEQNGTTKDNLEDTGNVSNINQNNNVASLLNNPGSAAAINQENSNKIEENAACNQTDEIPQQKTLRRSPRQDDMEKYEERLREAEMNAMQTQSPLMQSQASNELKHINTTTTTQNLSKLTENFLITERNKSPVSDDSNIKKTFDDEHFTHLGKTGLKDASDADHSSSNAGILDVEKDSLSYNMPKAPFIEIEHAPDDDTAAEQNAIPIQPHELEDDEDYEEVVVRPANLMEGLSDFYDFNASINPSRSPSVERRSRKSKSPSAARSSRSPFKSSQSSRPPVNTQVSSTILEGLSDFYDFNVMLNKHVYGQTRSTEAHRTSVDYIVAELKNEKPKINTLPRSTASKNGAPSLFEEGGRSRHKFSPGTPTTPEYERRLSANMTYIERMQNEYRENQFKRSTYVGESMDFENDFEELREQTRHFQRSRSKSRSPEPGRPGYASTSRQAQRALQEKILDEITRTTINFQEFSRDMNQEFLDHERRGSDSAMVQLPEILFQIQDIQKPGTFDDYDSTLDDYEPEEYHHFRRFSLDQAYQIEEYPQDEFDFIEQIEIKSERSWTNEEYYVREHINFNETHKLFEISEVSYDSSNHAEAEDLDTGSDDERQTVIEVDDENGEDVWNDDRADDHIENEIEFNEMHQDRHTDKEAHDWKEEGAVGGANIEDMYDDVMKNNEESGIEKDYNVIVEAIEIDVDRKSARNSGNFDSVSIRTEDLLEEILREDDEKYNISPKIREQLEEKESSQRFITNEVHAETKFSSTKISSTRLRSRYGLPPSTSYTDYDVSDLNVDLNYTPKKEYNWRKNFKLDDDDDSNDNARETSAKSAEEIEKVESDDHQPHVSFLDEITAEVESDDIQPRVSFLDPRKYSLGGESITLFSQSPYRGRSPEKYDIETSENWEYTENSKINDISEKEMQITQEIAESSEVTTKKKKSKKKSRKGSTEETTGILVNTEETDEATTKKKTKKKKKVTLTEPISPESQLKSPLPPIILSPTPTPPNSPTIVLNTETPTVPEKNITKPSIKTTEPNSSTLRNPSKTPEHIDPKSKAPESVKSTGPKPEPSGTSSTLQNPSKTTERIDEERSSKSKTPETVKSTEPKPEPSGTSKRPPLERNDSSGVYELIKDGSMYPWF